MSVPYRSVWADVLHLTGKQETDATHCKMCIVYYQALKCSVFFNIQDTSELTHPPGARSL